MAGDDLDGLRPYLKLAREIRAEVERVATGAPGATDLDAAFDAVPRRERRRVARAVFDRLGPEEQWAVLARVFGDEEIEDYLGELRQARRDEAGRRRTDLAQARAARAAGRLELGPLPSGVTLTLGLFRPADVRAAVARGAASSVVARQLVVVTTDTSDVRVLEDLFNPRHGLFVTPDYDEAVWADERLESHATARVGSEHDGVLEAALHPGGRVDVSVDGVVRRGRLHLGFVLVGVEDVFATTS